MKYRLVSVGPHNEELTAVNKLAEEGWRVLDWHVDDGGRSYYLMELIDSLQEIRAKMQAQSANT